MEAWQFKEEKEKLLKRLSQDRNWGAEFLAIILQTPRRELWEPLISSQSAESTGNHLDMGLASELQREVTGPSHVQLVSPKYRSTEDETGLGSEQGAGAVLQDGPLNLWIWCCLGVDSIGTELTCRAPSWCLESSWVLCREPPFPMLWRLSLRTQSIPSPSLTCHVLITSFSRELSSLSFHSRSQRCFLVP